MFPSPITFQFMLQSMLKMRGQDFSNQTRQHHSILIAITFCLINLTLKCQAAIQSKNLNCKLHSRLLQKKCDSLLNCKLRTVNCILKTDCRYCNEVVFYGFGNLPPLSLSISFDRSIDRPPFAPLPPDPPLQVLCSFSFSNDLTPELHV